MQLLGNNILGYILLQLARKTPKVRKIKTLNHQRAENYCNFQVSSKYPPISFDILNFALHVDRLGGFLFLSIG